MLCTQVLNGLTAAMKVLDQSIGREFEVVTVSFDPRGNTGASVGQEEGIPRSLCPCGRSRRMALSHGN